MIDLSFVIGKEYDSVFSVVDRQSGELKEVTEPQSTVTHEFFTGLDDGDAPDEDAPMVTEELKDNRNMKDDNKAQNLKHQDVELLKAQNLAGEAIIETLVKNSQTFEGRTVFSKAKYLRKKREKYSVWFEARRPTALSLCESYHRYAPEKICNLRPDSLAYLLNLANISF